MKKSALNLLLITIAIISFASCKSTMKGCGLTSDAQKMEQTTSDKTTDLAEV
jgi:predicted small secreted protein